MTGAHWDSNSWLFDAEKLWIRVSHGNRGRVWLNTPEAEDFDEVLGKQSKQQHNAAFLRKHFEKFGYTYVALYLGHAFSFERGEKVPVDHHVTIGYLPVSDDQDKRILRQKMENLIFDWKCLRPCQRPERLMKFKSYELKEFGSEETYDTWVHTTLEDMLPEEVEDLVKRKVLCEPAHEVHDENKSSLLQRALDQKNQGPEPKATNNPEGIITTKEQRYALHGQIRRGTGKLNGTARPLGVLGRLPDLLPGGIYP